MDDIDIVLDRGENVVDVTVERQSPVIQVEVIGSGPQGPMGPLGPTPDISIGTVSTLPEGSDATASMGGTPENPLLNLGIPVGATGAPGQDGADGADGQDGVTPEIFTSAVQLPAGSSPYAHTSGTIEQPLITFGIPSGADGQDGQDGADGADGVSPEVTIGTITGGHSVTITDADHPGGQTFNVMDGQDGQDGQDGTDGQDGADGVSPAVTVTDITGGHSVTITDADHPGGQSFNVMDGQTGPTGPGVPTGGTKGQMLVKNSSTDYDGKWDSNAYRAVSIPYGKVDNTSTSTAFTATVPGITELRDGVCMWLMNGKVTSASGFTININNLGAKPAYSSLAAASRSTTLFNVNYTMLFIYNENRVEGGCWDIVYGYDSNTTYTTPKLGFGYGTCSTAAATVAKTASITSYVLNTGGFVTVKFENDVPASATLNITSKGAKPIWYHGAAITAGIIKAGDYVTFVYSGSYYHLVSIDRIPTAADVGAVAANQGSGNAGKFLIVGNDGIVVPMTMAVWQGGSY